MMIVTSLLLVLSLQTSTVDLSSEEETRAQDLMREVRCMVCSGETILDSNSPMALDMRRFVREQVAAGTQDEGVREALVERFGHQVLMRPPVDGTTAILWIAPLLLLGFGGLMLFTSMRNKSKP